MSLHSNGIGFLVALWHDSNDSVVPTGCWQRFVGKLEAADRRASEPLKQYG